MNILIFWSWFIEICILMSNLFKYSVVNIFWDYFWLMFDKDVTWTLWILRNVEISFSFIFLEFIENVLLVSCYNHEYWRNNFHQLVHSYYRICECVRRTWNWRQLWRRRRRNYWLLSKCYHCDFIVFTWCTVSVFLILSIYIYSSVVTGWVFLSIR